MQNVAHEAVLKEKNTLWTASSGPTENPSKEILMKKKRNEMKRKLKKKNIFWKIYYV